MVLGIVRASTQRYNEHTFFSLILVCWPADATYMTNRYDESPQIWVALYLMSASREMKMLHAIRSIFKSLFRKGNDLDIMFVADSEAARIEAVCKPFFQCLSSP